jgi:hypothetical protein
MIVNGKKETDDWRPLNIPEPYRKRVAESIRELYRLPPYYDDEDVLIFYCTFILGIQRFSISSSG